MSDARPRLGLSIPLYDEQDLVEQVVVHLVETLRAANIPHSLVLVDNGSTDDTGPRVNGLCARYGLRALHLEVNAGYGGGILAGLRQLDTELVGWTWGDGQVAPEVVVAAYEKLVAEDLDLCKARRVERQDGLQRLVVSRIYNTVMKAYGVTTTDVNGCPKIVRRAAWTQLDARSLDWFLDPEVVLKAAEIGLRVGEVDAVMLPRAGGASKVRGDTVLQFLQHLRAWRGGWRP